ncbi:MAG: basic amino acid ABC transporter substrate-binding protein [Firmicutes bacterium]|mgnify:CR=1 FL=1|nr:basic amino acid ABC transporter substrate-binding protein [Bacillota bacterium]
MKKLTALVLSALLLFSLSIPAWGGGTLKVGTEAGFMPFEYVDEKTGELLGFDMDLIRAVGETLGLKVEIDNIHWDGLIPALLNKNYDAVIAGMTITEERAASVNFSEPYFESVLTIVIKDQDQGLIKGTEDLTGKIAAVQINTTGDFEATDLAEAGALKSVARFDTVPDSMQAVLVGAADVILVDLPVAKSYLAANPGAPLQHLGPITDNEFYGIAIHKQNPELLEQINSALKQLQADGTYDQIFDKWFGTE